MGVITVTDIDYGQIFGPFPSHLAMADPAYLIAVLTSDKRQGGVLIKVDTSEMKDGNRVVDWLPYVHPARNEDEQNIEAYMKEGEVYYRSLRIIKAHEELLVWYSKDFCQLLDIPEIQRRLAKDEDYMCPHCGEIFVYPFSLRAHVKFKCSLKTSDVGPNIQRMVERRHMDNVLSEYRHREQQRTNSVLQGGSKLFTESVPRRSGDSPDNSPIQLSPKRKDSSFSEASPKRKRTMSDSESPPPVKRFAVENEINTSHSDDERDRKSPLGMVDSHQNIGDIDSHTGGASAFRKVEKTHSPMKEQLSPVPRVSNTLSSLSARMAVPMSVHSSTRGPSNVTMTTPATSLPVQQEAPLQNQLLGFYMPRLPIMPQMALPTNLPTPSAAFPEQSPARFAEMCRSSLNHITGPLTESFANMRNRENGGETFSKPIFLAGTANMGYPNFMKSQNPMVEKMIHNGTNPTLIDSPVTALHLSQNWCAKCNATFRMTSDLVYHMRSHHKREFDPVKKKRDDKLRCSICNETFRERHHLTRHMTSHA